VRLFVAAYPSAAARDDFAGLVRKLSVGQPRERGHSVRLASVDNWHVTLAFIGEVPDASLDKARQAVERAVTTWRASDTRARTDTRAPTVRIAGGGTFGRGRFTTLWTDLRGDVDALTDLAAGLRRELRKARFPRDNKQFRPHITIARPGDRLPADELAGDLALLDGYQGPKWTVDRIQLMRSHLGPRPTYDVLAEVPLIG
jgi:RNA 2',3'-cyclic 3'-phosphodiesterase